MPRSRLEVWPSLGNAARAEPEPELMAAPGGDPRAPYAPGLGQWRVGAKTGLAVLTGDAGRTEVHTRAAGDPRGLGGDVAYLIFDKAVARERDDAARASGGRAEAGHNWYDLEAGVAPPSAVQRGTVDDPRGGRWHASGTLVEVSGPSDAVSQVFRAERDFYVAALAAAGAAQAPPLAEDNDDDDDIMEIDGAKPAAPPATPALPSSPLLKAACMVFHSYIHAQQLDAFEPPPDAPAPAESDSDDESDGAPAPRGKSASAAAKGKGPAIQGKGAASKGGRRKPAAGAAQPRARPPLLALHYCLITPEMRIVRPCVDVRDDLVSRMLAAGPSAAADVFSLRLAFRCEKQPGVVALACVTVMYHPYVDGAETRPAELAEATDGKMLVRRCGRTLQQVMKPMLLPLPFLGALGWPTDARDGRDGSYNKAMQAIRHPLQHRTSGFVDLSATFTPKSDKSDLMPTSDWTAALKALCENSADKVDKALRFAGASAQMAVCCPGPGPSGANDGVYRPLDPNELRRLFVS